MDLYPLVNYLQRQIVLQHEFLFLREQEGDMKKWFVSLTAFSFLLVWMCVTAEAQLSPPKKPVRTSPEEIELAGSLKKREIAVVAKEEALHLKEQELAVLQKEINEQLDRLSQLQEEVTAKLDEYKATKNKQFKNLINVYSSMSATKLAPLLGKMEDAVVAKILRAMPAENVSKIMPKLEQEQAVRVSKLLGVLD